MGLRELLSSITFITEVHADARPREGENNNELAEASVTLKSEEKGEDGEAKENLESKGVEDEQESGEEESEEEEPKDIFPELLEECEKSTKCNPYKHHLDECVERVTAAEAAGVAKEDCIEEFFHVLHCSSECAAPKLFSKLK